ncbi:MAG: sigma-70 family RNA polymerase sigma factor [Methylacidiphilales bacterium]|nr:sigma-70 family RNA polymerase sigma factor [Candidatus Methylacidiphilales bacterium]
MATQRKYFSYNHVEEDGKDSNSNNSRMPSLSLEYERELVLAIQKPETSTIPPEEAKSILVDSYRGLIIKIVRYYTSKIPDLISYREDLMQDGIVGLLTAVNRYDFSYNTRLSTYATPWIHSSIQNGIIKYIYDSKVPYHAHLKHDKSSNELFFAVCSLEEKTDPSKEDSNTYEDIIEDKSQGDMLSLISMDEDLQALRNAMQVCLKERERNVLILYYGLQGEVRKSGTQIAKMYGVSKQMINEIIKKAKMKLAEYINSHYNSYSV